MRSLEDITKAFNEMNVLVIGDVCLDVTQQCEAIGLSLESPTMKCQHIDRTVRLGWAGNVADNICELGARSCTLLTRVSKYDAQAIKEIETLTSGLLIKNIDSCQQLDMNQSKTRVWIKKGDEKYKYLQINAGDKLKRFDERTNSWLATYMHDDYNLIIIVDYGHAFTHYTMHALLDELQKLGKNVPVVAATQLSDKQLSAEEAYAVYTGCSTFMNISEAEKCYHEFHDDIIYDDRQLSEKKGYHEVSQFLSMKYGGNCYVTLGSRGSCVSNIDGEFIIQDAFPVKVNDVVGAGDAFMAATSLTLALPIKSTLSEQLMMGNAWAAAKLYDCNATVDDLWSVLY